MNNQDQARAYREAGLRVLRIRPDGKEPCTKGHGAGNPDATAEPSDFRPGERVAILCGPAPGLGDDWLLCLDFDGGLTSGQLEERVGALPDTLTSKRGAHRFYRVAPGPHRDAIGQWTGLLRTKKATGADLDLRWSGGYAVEPWEWDEPFSLRAIAELPVGSAWALYGLRQSWPRAQKPVPVAEPPTPNAGGRRSPLERCRKYVARIEGAVSGNGGHNATMRVACECVRFGLSDAEAMSVLREYSQRCDPQWSERELRHKLNSALGEAEHERGEKLTDERRAPSQSAPAHRPARPPPSKPQLPSKWLEDREVLPDGSPDTLARLVGPQLGYPELVSATDRLYGLESAAWREVPQREVYDTLQQYNGALYKRPRQGKNGAFLADTGLVQVSPGLLKQVGEMMRTQHEDNSFFDSAPVGAAFRDTFVGVSGPEPLSSEHRQRAVLSWEFMPDVDLERDAPMFHCALSEWFEGDPDDAEKAACLGEFAGLALIGGFGPSELGRANIQTAVMNLGDGANGKSVFLGLLHSMMPREYVSNVPPQDMGNEYYRDMIAGKRVNICPEIPERDVIAAGHLKAVISCDPGMTARAPYGRPYAFQPIAGHVFSANSLPRFNDTSGGFMRRWIVVSWNNVVPEHKRDPALCQKLLEHEGAAIASWFVLRGFEAFKRGRLTTPSSSETAKNAWRGDSDQVQEYREERLVAIPPGARQVDWTPTEELYSDYCRWAPGAGHRLPLARRAFVKRLQGVCKVVQAKRNGKARLPLRLRENDFESWDEEL